MPPRRGPGMAVLRPSARETDFFYGDELGVLQEAGTLTKLSLAWSRDGGKKVYVQDRMREAGRRAVRVAREGAHFYICGDAKRMAKDVESGARRCRRRARQGLGRRCQGLRRGPEEGRPLSGGRLLMNALSPCPQLPPCAPPAPIAGWAAGSSRGPTACGGAAIAGRSRASRQLRPAVLQGLGAWRNAGARRPAAASDDARRDGTMARASGMTRSTASPRLRANRRRSTAPTRRLLRLRPTADGGLLRRQQADEGLHRHRPTSTPIRGSAWRRRLPGHRRAFGSDTVPGCYEDLDAGRSAGARRLERGLVPSRAVSAHAWQTRRERGASIVVIDPRAHRDGESADLHLADRSPARSRCCSRPAGRISPIMMRIDRGFIGDTRTVSRGAARARRHRAGPASGGRADAGLPRGDIETFYCLVRRHAARRDALLAGRQPVGAGHRQGQRHHQLPPGDRPHRQARHGAVLADRASPTPWAGARSAVSPTSLPRIWTFRRREVDRVGRFWVARAWRRARASRRSRCSRRSPRGEIKALWVMATNPAVSLPRADAVRTALAAARSARGLRQRGRHRYDRSGAHVLLPAAAWGEKDGTVTNSERRISRQRAFLPLPAKQGPTGGSSRKWRSGWASRPRFPMRPPADIFREHCELSDFENGGSRDFDLSGLVSLSDEDYDALAPVQWPIESRRHARPQTSVRFR